MLDDLRLAYRHQRTEAMTLLGGALIVSAALVIVTWQIGLAVDALSSCQASNPRPDHVGAICRAEGDWASALVGAGSAMGMVASLVPFFAGVLLGAPLVAGEVEHRTASLAWSLNPSRRTWLFRRAVPLTAAFVVAIGSLALANAELLLAASHSDRLSFNQYGLHGPVLVLRGLTALAIGILVGSLVGRVLPAVLLTGLLVIGLVSGLSLGREMLMREEAVAVPMSSVVGDSPVYDGGYRVDATGEMIGWEEAYERYPELAESQDGTLPGLTMMWRVVPHERLPSYVVRESAVLGAAILVILAVGFYQIGSRRPL